MTGYSINVSNVDKVVSMLTVCYGLDLLELFEWETDKCGWSFDDLYNTL